MIILTIIILDDSGHTVDGTNPAPVQVGSLSHYSQGFLHPRWLFGISEPSTVGKAVEPRGSRK